MFSNLDSMRHNLHHRRIFNTRRACNHDCVLVGSLQEGFEAELGELECVFRELLAFGEAIVSLWIVGECFDLCLDDGIEVLHSRFANFHYWLHVDGLELRLESFDGDG